MKRYNTKHTCILLVINYSPHGGLLKNAVQYNKVTVVQHIYIQKTDVLKYFVQ